MSKVEEFPAYRHGKSKCPQCGYTMDASTKIHGEEATPEAGDASVCINCGQVLTYEADLRVRKATAEEVRELMQVPEAWATIEKAQSFIRRRGRFA